MHYTLETFIHRDRETVVALFSNPENMVHWADGFVRLETLTGEPGAAGSTNKLVFKQRKRLVELVETIEENRLPERFVAIYECGPVWNRAVNRFEPTGEGQTRWIAEHEFRFRGFMKIIGIVMKGAFPKETRKQMNAFKAFAEQAT